MPDPSNSSTKAEATRRSMPKSARRVGSAAEQLPQSIDGILGPQGWLATHLGRYEYRPQQVDMARCVEQTLQEGGALIVEAATGTGKTLAYLVPALLSGKRVVISTGTKALQEQLFHKDIPLVSKNWHEPVRAMLLKGRRNYLCKLRYQEMLASPSFRAPRDGAHWPAIQDWFEKTTTGDRAEISGLPDDFATWADLSVGSEACQGSKCRHYETCFVTQARRQATDAQIVVVNHHLFFADLALRQGGYSEILPSYDAVIFDEAHHLEEIASNYFGVQVSNFTLSELIHDIRRVMQSEALHDQSAEALLKRVTQRGTSFFTLIAFGLHESRYELDEIIERGPQAERTGEAHHELAAVLSELERELKRFSQVKELAERMPERAAQLKFDLEMLMRADDDRYTYFMELRERGVFLHAAPIDLAEILQQRLFASHDTLVFTSATLSTNHDFTYFKQRVGLDPALQAARADEDKEGEGEGEEKKDEKGSKIKGITPDDVTEVLLDPVFDYEDQCLIYVPRRLSAPNSPQFVDGVCQIVEYLVGIAEGRAFILFTSWANMRAVHERIADKLSYTVLMQGERPKNELIRQFREDTHSVLFATSSFWEGVDVEGEALSLVILDKLPFASPSDPLNRARMELLEARGKNSFMHFSVPQAALMLKQGFGRLIRSRTDRGVVAILDSRIAHKRYGKHFLKTLPPAPVVWNASEVKRWWHEHMIDRADASDE